MFLIRDGKKKIVFFVLFLIFILTSFHTLGNDNQVFTFAAAGDLEKVTEYVKNGGDINALDSTGRTLLVYASLGFHNDIIKYLLEHGADPNIEVVYNLTPLHLCVQGNNFEAVKLLMKYKADMYILETKSAGNNRKTPPMLAFLMGNMDMFNYFIGLDYDINFFIKLKSKPILQLWIESKKYIEENTKRDFFGILDYLLKLGADPNLAYIDNYPIIGYALTENQFDTFKVLLEHGGNPNLEYAGDTLLSIAVRGNNINNVSLLLSYNADPNVSDKYYGYFPLLYIAKTNNFKIADLLIQAGADVNLQTNNGTSALHGCANLNNIKFAKYLLEHGAKKDLKNEKGETPYDIAVRKGYTELAKLLKP